ncbi:MAG: KilA-N domain-containing protein [Pseudomonadota bacterium]
MPKHQLDLPVIPHVMDGKLIHQRAADGYINATAMCNAAGKLIGHFLENKTTALFLAELQADIGIPISTLVQTTKGGNSAYQGTWVHPQVAIQLAQWLSPKFAVQVSSWVLEWLSNRTPPVTAPSQFGHHLTRYLANESKVPPGYFSILQETALGLFGPLQNLGFDIPKGWVPDISVGRGFCAWLRDVKGINTDELHTYVHDYVDGRKVPGVKLYPEELLVEYKKWFRAEWLPKNGTKYFQSKDPASLTYLNRLPALQAPQKTKGIGRT